MGFFEGRKKKLSKIAKLYKVEVEFEPYTLGRNEACCLKSDEYINQPPNSILMGEFDDEDLFTISFFHELAHCVYPRYLFKIARSVNLEISSALAEEATAWEYAFALASRYGYQWPKNSKVYKFAYENLFSYVFSEKDNILRLGLSVKEIKRDVKEWKEWRNEYKQRISEINKSNSK